MKNSTRIFSWLLIAITFLFAQNAAQAQSILNPSDTIVTFNPADTPAIPAYGQIAKWVRTVRMSWNTSNWKCYIYNGNQFRLRFPPDYNPTANDGKLYPMLIFMHGDGEGGSVYDNEYSLYHGGNVFESAVSGGTFDGYVLVMQTSGSWGPNQMVAQQYIIDYMIRNNKLDPFRVYLNGLSAGGAGDWEFYQSAPTYPAGVLPMSSVAIALDNPDTVAKYKYTPIWMITGGLDGSPAPYTAQQVTNAMTAQGANFTWLDMTTQGHDTWDSAWSMTTFWPWLKAQYSSNPWCLFGRTQFCPGDSINVTVGLVAGFQAYQWRKNGVVISGATSNTINVTSVGTYDARVERNGNWSNWSPVPVVISIKAPTVTPPITVSGLMSDVLPATDGRNYVTLTVPDSNYTSFTWEKVGSDSVIGTQQTLKVTQPGQYIVQVTQQYGCSSNFSPPFRVVNAGGPNPPSPASNLVASALSYTQVQLVWARNPHPANPETGFEIYRATNVTGPFTFAGLVPADTVDFLDKGLQPNVKYYYVVRAVDSTGAAAVSNEGVVVTESDKTPPSAPGNLNVVTTSSTSVTLSWNNSTDNVAVTGYYIYVNGAKSYATAAGDTTFVVSDLTPNQEYSFFVVAVDGSGNASGHSNQVSGASVNTGLFYSYYNLSASPSVMPQFSTLTPAFTGNMPNVSIANATATTNFAYEWNGYINIPVTGSYVFQTVSDDGSQVWLGSLNQQTFPYNYSGGSTLIVNANRPQGATATNSATLTLQAGTYPISIAYFQAGGGYSMALNWMTPASGGNFVAIPNSAFASSFTPAGTPPARPTGVTASAIAYNKVNVGWTDNSSNETGFEIWRYSSSNAKPGIVGTMAANATSFVDSSVSGSTTYFYMVQAVNTYGASGFDSASLSGVSYSFYQGVWNIMPPFATATPVSTGHINNFSLSPAGTVTTDFAFKFSGFINIPTTGSYTFYTTSDDGSDLYVGGFDSAHLVVANDYLQGATQRSGTVSLTQGRYPIYVTYVQQGGGYSLATAYKGPGIAQQNIPDSALYCKTSMTTTPALPKIPGAPYGVTATALSASKVGLSWSDSSATVTGYVIYRSIGDTLHFISFTSVAAGTTTFTDTALFANTTYYYKIVASGVAGNSGYSAMASAATPDVLPVIAKLPVAEQARYGTTTVFRVSATSVNSGALTFAAYNLPSFATFADNGNGTGTLTVTPSAANAGNYPGLYIVVTDGYGGTDTTKFNLAVNNNYTPVMTPVNNVTMNEGDTLTVALTGSNQNPADTLSFAVAGAPGNSVVTPVSNGAATLFLHPGYAAAGTYTVVATLNDNNGLSTTDTFTVKVNYKSPITKVFTRVVYNDANALGVPWNGLLGTSTSNLVDSNGNVTALGLQFSPGSWWTPYNGGSSTGNNSGVYPDEVLENYMWFGSYYGGPNTFSGTVTGADTSSLYDLTFFANSTYNGFTNNGSTTFTAGGTTLTLAVQNNQHNTVTIPNLKAAADGTIPFTLGIGPNTNLGYFSALVITKHFDDGTVPAGISGLTATDAPSQVQLSWTDSAYNATGYEVWRALTAAGGYSLLGTVPGNSANSYVDSTVTGSTGYSYKVRAVNANGNSLFDSVSTVTLHRLPKITAIQNIIMKDTQSVTVNVTTTDDSTAQLTLTASNLPPFATFTDNGNGTGVLTISPSAGTVGMYSNVSIMVADALDSTASTSFSIAVTEPNVQSVYLNFTGGVVSPAPWNSMTTPPYQGTVLSNLTDDSGTPTGISATLLDGWYWFGTTGFVTGNSDGVYPPSVIQNFYYEPTTNTRRIQISGLSNAKQYNFVFFNSQWDGTNGLTTFTINGDSIQSQPDWNISKTVSLNGIRPVNGVVTINVRKASGAANAYLNSIVIQGYDTAAGTLLNPVDLRATGKTQTTVSLQWQDRSAIETGYEVWKASDSTGSYSLLASLPANATTYRDAKLGRGANYYYIVRAVNGGVYSNYSNVLAVTTYSDAVYIHPSTSAAGDGPTPPWNNLNSAGGTGTSWSNFIDSTGAITSVGMVQTGEFAGANALGDVTGNNSGVYPDPVLLQQYVLFPGNFGSFTISGLNLSKTYDFTFFGSENYEGGNNNTGYIVNGDTVYLNALDNTNATVTLHGVTPSSLGQATVTMYCPGGSLAGWFNAMVIDGYTPLAQNAPAVPAVTGISNTLVNTVTGNQFNAAATTTPALDSVIQAYPNPFHSSFTLSVPVFSMSEKVMVTLFDANGRLVYRKEFDNVLQGVNYLTIGADANIGAPGVYIGKVIFSGGRTSQSFKIIKN